jgi:hypothetical protein
MFAPMICGVVLSHVPVVFDLEPLHSSSLLLPCCHGVAGTFGVVGGVVHVEILAVLLVELGARTWLKWAPLCVPSAGQHRGSAVLVAHDGDASRQPGPDPLRAYCNLGKVLCAMICNKDEAGTGNVCRSCRGHECMMSSRRILELSVVMQVSYTSKRVNARAAFIILSAQLLFKKIKKYPPSLMLLREVRSVLMMAR